MSGKLKGSALMRPLVVLVLPGMYLFYKYSQYKQERQEKKKRKLTERELSHLNHKIEKLLTKLDEELEPELATSLEDECVICVNAKATMETSPCGHRVVCRKCFVKTIQTAVSQRLLPLRCVICRAKILRLSGSRHSSGGSALPGSVSKYSMSSSSSGGGVISSESFYSMSSGSSGISGVSSSSSSGSTVSGSGKTGKPTNKKVTYRQPAPASRDTHAKSMKYQLGQYVSPEAPTIAGRHEEPTGAPGHQRIGSSTRIRCAQKIVRQLETKRVTKDKPSGENENNEPPLKEKESKTKKTKKKKKSAGIEDPAETTKSDTAVVLQGKGQVKEEKKNSNKSGKMKKNSQKEGGGEGEN